MEYTRRKLLKLAALGALSTVAGVRPAMAAALPPVAGSVADTGEDRVFICNEDSNTLAVINPIAIR